MQEFAATTIAAIITIGIICQWVLWRVKLLVIIFLLLAGIAAGPLFSLIK